MNFAKIKLAIIAGSLILSGAAQGNIALAQETQQLTKAQEKAAKKARKRAEKEEKRRLKNHPDTVKCKFVSVTGSRLNKTKVCLTNKQWNEGVYNIDSETGANGGTSGGIEGGNAPTGTPFGG